MNALKTQKGSGGSDPLISYVDAAKKVVEYFNTPGALTSSNKPRYTLNETLGGSPQTASTFRSKEVVIHVK